MQPEKWHNRVSLIYKDFIMNAIFPVGVNWGKKILCVLI